MTRGSCWATGMEKGCSRSVVEEPHTNACTVPLLVQRQVRCDQTQACQCTTQSNRIQRADGHNTHQQLQAAAALCKFASVHAGQASAPAAWRR